MFQVQREALFNKSERQVAESQLAAIQQKLSEIQAQSSHIQELHNGIQESQNLVKEKDRKVRWVQIKLWLYILKISCMQWSIVADNRTV